MADPRTPPPDAAAPKRPRLALSLSQLRPTIAIIWRASPMGTLALLVLTVLSALLPVQMAYVGKLIIDAFVGARTVPDVAALESAQRLFR